MINIRQKILLLVLLFINTNNINSNKLNVDFNFSNLQKIYYLESTIILDTIECVSTPIYSKYNTTPKRYNFSYIVRPNSKREIKLRNNTFQISKYDRGNYNHDNVLVGTNRSISAKTFERYTNKIATIEAMKNISIHVAIEIYQKEFWEYRMQGNLMKVHNPLLLDMIFNAICSSSGTHHFKDVLYDMTGFKIPKSKLKYITKEEIKVFNNLCKDLSKEESFYKKYWTIRNSYYNKRSTKKGMKGLSKWIIDYPYDSYNTLKV